MSASKNTKPQPAGSKTDFYFSADVETDGPIPGPYSMLSFALVAVGEYDGKEFRSLPLGKTSFYRELKPISAEFEPEALQVNKLDREKLLKTGGDPAAVMTEACEWVKATAGGASPVLVAYPVAFDWTWLYWYFTRYSLHKSPFNHSRCFDLKTAYAVSEGLPIVKSGREELIANLKINHNHTHHALDDAVEQAEIFCRLIERRIGDKVNRDDKLRKESRTISDQVGGVFQAIRSRAW